MVSDTWHARHRYHSKLFARGIFNEWFPLQRAGYFHSLQGEPRMLLIWYSSTYWKAKTGLVAPYLLSGVESMRWRRFLASLQFVFLYCQNRALFLRRQDDWGSIQIDTPNISGHVCTYMYIHGQIYMFTCVDLCMCTYLLIYICYRYRYVYMYIFTYVYMLHAYVCMSLLMCKCVYVYEHKYLYVLIFICVCASEYNYT